MSHKCHANFTSNFTSNDKPAVVLVIMYVETIKTDIIVFISEIIMCLM
jgi:hypothetical protein